MVSLADLRLASTVENPAIPMMISNWLYDCVILIAYIKIK
jgi:hypothetical protein